MEMEQLEIDDQTVVQHTHQHTVCPVETTESILTVCAGRLSAWAEVL